MEKFYTLTQDNGSCNDDTFSKITIRISKQSLEYELKNYFKWRKNIGIERLMKQGSSNYDKFIRQLSEAGYKK